MPLPVMHLRNKQTIVKTVNAPNCHCEERSDVAISGRQLRFRRSLSHDSAGYCEIATSAVGLLAMARQEAFRILHSSFFSLQDSFFSLQDSFISVPRPYSELPGKAQKSSDLSIGASCWRYLSSRAVTRKVLSAQMSLTSVFGMGTGVPSPQSTPTIGDTP